MMGVMSALFLLLGSMVCHGRTDLIHDYHQTHIPKEQKAAYGKAFSKGLFALSLTCFISGIIALFKNTGFAAPMVLLIGLVISLVILFVVQKKYNGSLF